MINNLLTFASSCSGPKLFEVFPTWYEYLPKGASAAGSTCSPALTSLSDVWLIVAAVIEILLRLASLAAVGFVIYGGIMFTTSQGSPDQTTQARNTVINALIGLAIAVSASIVVAFLAESFS
jgi:ABC-type Fe3+ transport system permease subunit